MTAGPPRPEPGAGDDAAGDTGDGGTSVSPDARRLWRAARGPVVIAAIVLLVAIGTALLADNGEGGALDPRAVTPDGSRALARLLQEQDVRVDVALTVDAAIGADGAGDGDTLLVTRPDLLLGPQLDAVRDSGADVVLIGPDDDVLTVFGLDAAVGGTAGVTAREPECALAAPAGLADLGGTRYSRADTACYDGHLVVDDGVTLVGGGAPFANERLDDNGNAALTMRLLGANDRLVWFVPTPGDPSLRAEQRPLSELIPDAWLFAVVQLAIAAALFALWRARRLGPVVAEPLPVVVRAAETVEGRGRLYRRARARDLAAESLRAAAIARVAPGARRPDPHSVVDAVVRRTGRPPAEAHDLLYGPPPPDDAALVRLADALDTIERPTPR